MKIVTEDASSNSTVTLTFPKAGSASEQLDEQGAALTNKCLNFMSGSGLSTRLIQRTIEDQGGLPFSTVDRLNATMGFTVVPEKAMSLIPLLATDCSFEKWDVRDAKAIASKESKIASESSQVVLTENLFAAAYGPQSPAGRPIYSGVACSSDTIKAFRAKAYGLNGAILAATGVKDHASFVAKAESLLKDSPVGTASESPKLSYMGGESRISVPTAGLAHVALAFQGPTSSIMSSIVVQALGVMGKEAGVSSFAAPGLVGVYSCGEGAISDAMVATIKTSVSADILKRAKTLAKADAMFALDNGSKSLASVMTTSVLESLNYSSPADVAKAYDAVSDKQVADAIATMLKSNPALAAVGDLAMIPYHATVAASLK